MCSAKTEKSEQKEEKKQVQKSERVTAILDEIFDVYVEGKKKHTKKTFAMLKGLKGEARSDYRKSMILQTAHALAILEHLDGQEAN